MSSDHRALVYGEQKTHGLIVDYLGVFDDVAQALKFDEKGVQKTVSVVDDIDEIVRAVRFDGWQATHAGEREVKKALRQTLFKYKLHQDAELFERAYGYIREYY